MCIYQMYLPLSYTLHVHITAFTLYKRVQCLNSWRLCHLPIFCDCLQLLTAYLRVYVTVTAQQLKASGFAQHMNVHGFSVERVLESKCHRYVFRLVAEKLNLPWSSVICASVLLVVHSRSTSFRKASFPLCPFCSPLPLRSRTRLFFPDVRRRTDTFDLSVYFCTNKLVATLSLGCTSGNKHPLPFATKDSEQAEPELESL